MNATARSYISARAVAIALSMGIAIPAHAAKPNKSSFLRIGSSYKILSTADSGLPKKVVVLESAGNGWFRCAKMRSHSKHGGRPGPSGDNKIWINFSQVLGVVEIHNDRFPELSELKGAIADQAAKVEERRRLLGAMEEAKSRGANGSDEGDPNSAAGGGEEAIRRGMAEQDYMDAKRDFETDRMMLRRMKLKLNEEMNKRK